MALKKAVFGVLLTPRERDLLPLMKTGLSHKQIAAKIGISLSTTKLYSQRLYRKYGVRDRMELIAILDASTLPVQGLELRMCDVERKLGLILKALSS
jgi:DNA-binding NarL/FixJ family response regulator